MTGRAGDPYPERELSFEDQHPETWSGSHPQDAHLCQKQWRRQGQGGMRRDMGRNWEEGREGNLWLGYKDKKCYALANDAETEVGRFLKLTGKPDQLNIPDEFQASEILFLKYNN